MCRAWAWAMKYTVRKKKTRKIYFLLKRLSNEHNFTSFRARQNYNNFYWLKWRREQVLIEILSFFTACTPRRAINQSPENFHSIYHSVLFLLKTTFDGAPKKRREKLFLPLSTALPAVAKLICPQFDTRLKFISLRRSEGTILSLARGNIEERRSLTRRLLPFRGREVSRIKSTMSQLWMTWLKHCKLNW